MRGEGVNLRYVEVGNNPPRPPWGCGGVDKVVRLNRLGGENGHPPTALVGVHGRAGDVNPLKFRVEGEEGVIAPVVRLLHNDNIIVGKEVFDKLNHFLEPAPSSPGLVNAETRDINSDDFGGGEE